jgi:hypothetical protein
MPDHKTYLKSKGATGNTLTLQVQVMNQKSINEVFYACRQVSSFNEVAINNYDNNTVQLKISFNEIAWWQRILLFDLLNKLEVRIVKVYQ